MPQPADMRAGWLVQAGVMAVVAAAMLLVSVVVPVSLHTELQVFQEYVL